MRTGMRKGLVKAAFSASSIQYHPIGVTASTSPAGTVRLIVVATFAGMVGVPETRMDDWTSVPVPFVAVPVSPLYRRIQIPAAVAVGVTLTGTAPQPRPNVVLKPGGL